MKAGTIFDNILVSDDFADAEELANATFIKNRDEEKKMFDKFEEERRQKDAEELKSQREEGDQDVYEDGIDAEHLYGDMDADYDEYDKDEL